MSPQLFLFIGAALISMVCMGLITYSLLKLRFKSSPDKTTTPGFTNNALLEIVWAIIPAAILISLLVLTYQAM